MRVRRRVREGGGLEQHAHAGVDPQRLARRQLDRGWQGPVGLATARRGAARHREQRPEPAAVDRARRECAVEHKPSPPTAIGRAAHGRARHGQRRLLQDARQHAAAPHAPLGRGRGRGRARVEVSVRVEVRVRGGDKASGRDDDATGVRLTSVGAPKLNSASSWLGLG